MKEHLSFKQLSEYNEKTLISAADYQTIEKHLEECPVCRMELDKIRDMLQMLAGLKDFIGSPAGDLTPEIIRQIKGKGHPHFSQQYRWKRYLPAAASAASIAIITSYLLFPSSYNGQPPVSQTATQYEAGGRTKRGGKMTLYSNHSLSGTASLLKKYNVRNLQISGNCVIGEIGRDQYEKLRRELQYSNLFDGRSARRNPLIHEVSTSDAQEDRYRYGPGSGMTGDEAVKIVLDVK